MPCPCLSRVFIRVTVAVIVPAWNAADTIAQTLRSILGQRRAASEIVVVDDGSDDQTAAIVTELVAGGAPIRLLRQGNAGPSAARNRAIAHTRAPLIAPIDADDLWHPDYLARTCATLESEPRAGFAFARHHLIDEAGELLRPAITFPASAASFGGMLLVNAVGNGSSAVFRREAIAEAGGYAPPSPDWPGAEDYLLQLRIAARRSIIGIPAALVSYRKRAGSLSTDARKARRARLQAVRLALDEAGPAVLPVERWVAGDALRVCAVSALRDGYLAHAAIMALRALMTDPNGTAQDGMTRLRNLARRRLGIPCHNAGQAPDRLLAARLDRLARSMPMGRISGAPKVRPSQPSIRPSNWDAK